MLATIFNKLASGLSIKIKLTMLSGSIVFIAKGCILTTLCSYNIVISII